jgi:hypothetical protein
LNRSASITAIVPPSTSRRDWVRTNDAYGVKDESYRAVALKKLVQRLAI